MPNCVAINCSSGTEKDGNKTFHKFPLNESKQLEKWISNMNRKNFKPTEFSLLCSDHFEESCFDQTAQTPCIRDGAVPTIFKFKEENSQKCDTMISEGVTVKVEDCIIPQIVDVSSLVSTETTNKYETNELITKVKEECLSPSPIFNYSSIESSEELKRRFILTQVQFQIETSRKKLKLLQQRSRRSKRRMSHLPVMMMLAQDLLEEGS